MPRYIDADDTDNITVFLDSRGYLKRIEAPTADVAPVVHGHWIVTDNGANGKTADCSVCGAHFVYFKGHLQMDKMPGCPKCLAKMDEKISHAQQATEEDEVMKKNLTMPHTYIVDSKKWEEAQKRAEEFWASEEGQRIKQQIRDNAATFRELMTTGKTTVRVITNEESVEDEEAV